MAWYRTGRASSVAGSNIITGTGTLWASNVFGIAPGQILAVPGGGSILQYEILAVDSDTKIRIATNATTTVNNSEYAIVTTVANSYSALARQTSANLAVYEKLLSDWNNITTGTGDVTIIAPDGSTVVIPSLSDLTAWVNDSKTWFNDNRELIENAGEAVAGAGVARDQAVAANTAAQAAKTTAVNSATTASNAEATATGAATTATTAKNDAVAANTSAQAAKTAAEAAAASVNLGPLGIGLPTQTDIANFDWQNFVFTSGANYVTSYNTWVNPPAGITYNAGTRVSIRVIYISTVNGPRMGLELTPDTGSAANFKVYKLLCVGAAGSRVFTFNQDWNSANPIPITGGGTGATTAAGALVNLGLGEGSLIPIGVPLPYPLATAPTGYLKCNGSSFSTTTYPQLAVAYPSGVLPDLRAFTIRGWDDGRGIDTGRTLLSEQADALQNITGGMMDMITSTTPSASGAFALTSNIIGYTDQTTRSGRIVNFNFDASRIARTAAETRVRNIAFNYIVRAI